MIFNEYTQRINAAALIVQSINDSTKVIKSNLGGIQAQLNTVSTQIGTLNAAMLSFGNFLDAIYKAVYNFLIKENTVKENGLNAFYGLFGLVLALNILNLIGVVLFGVFKIQFFRYFSHFAWFCLGILIILLFIMGSIFAIFGVLGIDLSTSFSYLFSSAQISVLFRSNPQAAQLLDVCVNNDGDIANRVFNLSNTNVNSIAILQNASVQLGVLVANLTSNTQSISVPYLNSIYNNFLSDIITLNIGDNDSPINAFTSWYKWSDSLSGSFMSQCGNPAKDRWVQNTTRCSSGYTYTVKTIINPGSQACLLVSDWDSTVYIINYIVNKQ